MGSENVSSPAQARRIVRVLADGEVLPIDPSLKVCNHSSTGFEWGYSGSGPAQTALAILLDYTGKRNFAERFHQDCKFERIASAPREGWIINSACIDRFIAM